MKAESSTCTVLRQVGRRKLARWRLDSGVKSGSILRSQDEPAGISGIKLREQEYVNEENQISEGMAEFMTNCYAKEVGFSMEYPKESLSGS